MVAKHKCKAATCKTATCKTAAQARERSALSVRYASLSLKRTRSLAPCLEEATPPLGGTPSGYGPGSKIPSAFGRLPAFPPPLPPPIPRPKVWW